MIAHVPAEAAVTVAVVTPPEVVVLEIEQAAELVVNVIAKPLVELAEIVWVFGTIIAAGCANVMV